MSIFAKMLKISFLTLSLLSAQILSAASDDDDYLKQLEMEATGDFVEESDFLEPQETSLDAPASDSELILDKKELISDKPGFEKALKGIYPENYGLYMELSDQQKESIYKGFVKNKRLYNSSVKIISVYLSSH